MSTKVQFPPAAPHRIPQGRLWFGTCAGAAAFVIQGFTCFQIAIQSCKDGHIGDWGPLNAAGVRWVAGSVSMFMLAVAIWAGFVSYRNWRIVSEQRRLTNAEGKSREAFMSLIGVFVSVVFAIAIIWASLPMAVLDTCVTAR